MKHILFACLTTLITATAFAGTITYEATGTLGGSGSAVGEIMTFTATFDDQSTFVNGSGYISVQADSNSVNVTGGHTASFSSQLWLVIAPWDNSVKFSGSSGGGTMFSIFEVDGNFATGGGGTGSGTVTSVPAVGDTITSAHLPSIPFPLFSSFSSPGNYAYTLSTAPIPEPTTALLLTLGLAGLGMRRRVH